MAVVHHQRSVSYGVERIVGVSPWAEQVRRSIEMVAVHQSSVLIIGPSGTGKSTLINLLAPDARAQVGEVSHALNSGRHTTTSTQWYWLDAERHTGLIDSPGFQEFGLKQVDAQKLPALMPDLREASTHCRFYNCTHRQEPGCGVREALAQGEISESRYRIYGEIRQELEGTRW